MPAQRTATPGQRCARLLELAAVNYGAGPRVVHDAAQFVQRQAPVETDHERADLAAELKARAQPGDLVITLGAGDITNTGPELLALLPQHIRPALTVGKIMSRDPQVLAASATVFHKSSCSLAVDGVINRPHLLTRYAC